MPKTLEQELKILLADKKIDGPFKERVALGGFTKSENLDSHICVMFVAYDPVLKEVFIGHHKKADSWIFTGGHIEAGEGLSEAVVREIGEEWGQSISIEKVPEPELFTVYHIQNERQRCKTHFDIWYFFPVNKHEFRVNMELMAEEFYDARWVGLEESYDLDIPETTVSALDYLKTVCP